MVVANRKHYFHSIILNLSKLDARDSFLWKIAPDNQLRVFKWSGKNDYVALCESEYISFGGG